MKKGFWNWWLFKDMNIVWIAPFLVLGLLILLVLIINFISHYIWLPIFLFILIIIIYSYWKDKKKEYKKPLT